MKVNRGFKSFNDIYQVSDNICHDNKEGQVDNFLEMDRNLFILCFRYFECIMFSTTVTIDDSDDEEL